MSTTRNPKELRAEASRKESAAESLRFQAEDLSSEAARLHKEADRLDKEAIVNPLLPTLRTLWATAMASGLTWFEQCAIQDCIHDPFMLESAQRDRVLLLARQYLGLHLELPRAWGGWEG